MGCDYAEGKDDWRQNQKGNLLTQDYWEIAVWVFIGLQMSSLSDTDSDLVFIEEHCWIGLQFFLY